jgi:phosphoglycolate phosphatase-like HAD superfamily hydrolase
MKQNIIYALDFDGVICDSAVETAITGWKAGLKIWDDFNAPRPSQSVIDKFRLVRPIMETGYEAILIIRLLYQGETVETLLSHYAEKIQQTIDASNKDISVLKQIFGETRDIWINEDVNDWVMMNPLFPSIAEKLQQLNEQGQWFIITTKQERFVTQILNAYQIELDQEKIFGLDRNMSKEAILTELSNQYSQHEFYFVEDRLPTLLNVLANKDLRAVKLFLATWGYNTQDDKKQAEAQARIALIDIEKWLFRT